MAQGALAERLHKVHMSEAALASRIAAMPRSSSCRAGRGGDDNNKENVMATAAVAERRRLVHQLSVLILTRINILGQLEECWRGAGRVAWAHDMATQRREAALKLLLCHNDLGELLVDCVLVHDVDPHRLSGALLSVIAAASSPRGDAAAVKPRKKGNSTEF